MIIEFFKKIIEYIINLLKIFKNNPKNNYKYKKTYELTTLELLSKRYNEEKNEKTMKIIENEKTNNINQQYENNSRWESMRLKKHFTVQTNLLLKPNETQFVGAFSVSTELKTIKKSPFACNFIIKERYTFSFKYFYKRRIHVGKICNFGFYYCNY
jgi:hypothetical protein